jgi:hypothetical protein
VMKFDFTKRTFGPVGNVIMFDDDVHVLRRQRMHGSIRWWGDPIVGNDGCIYWPPRDCNRVL